MWERTILLRQGALTSRRSHVLPSKSTGSKDDGAMPAGGGASTTATGGSGRGSRWGLVPGEARRRRRSAGCGVVDGTVRLDWALGVMLVHSTLTGRRGGLPPLGEGIRPCGRSLVPVAQAAADGPAYITQGNVSALSVSTPADAHTSPVTRHAPDQSHPNRSRSRSNQTRSLASPVACWHSEAAATGRRKPRGPCFAPL